MEMQTSSVNKPLQTVCNVNAPCNFPLRIYYKFSGNSYLPPATKLGQGNIFRSVCQEFCPRGGGVCLSACWDTTPPGPATPLIADHPRTRNPPRVRCPPAPWGQAPPLEQSMLGDMVNERAVRILLECNLVH